MIRKFKVERKKKEVIYVKTNLSFVTEIEYKKTM